MTEPDVEGRLEGAEVKNSGTSSSLPLSLSSSADDSDEEVLVWYDGGGLSEYVLVALEVLQERKCALGLA